MQISAGWRQALWSGLPIPAGFPSSPATWRPTHPPFIGGLQRRESLGCSVEEVGFESQVPDFRCALSCERYPGKRCCRWDDTGAASHMRRGGGACGGAGALSPCPAPSLCTAHAWPQAWRPGCGKGSRRASSLRSPLNSSCTLLWHWLCSDSAIWTGDEGIV